MTAAACVLDRHACAAHRRAVNWDQPQHNEPTILSWDELDIQRCIFADASQVQVRSFEPRGPWVGNLDFVPFRVQVIFSPGGGAIAIGDTNVYGLISTSLSLKADMHPSG